MLSAAKEEMLSAFGPWCAETCISANESQGEKAHQGVAGKNPALHQGITWSNSTVALGLRSLAVENRVGSRCTGKERDTESGLDNFGARYEASNLGRFMTPDWAAKPATVPYAKFGDPQTLNLYAYTENGPVNKIDADGHIFGNPDVLAIEEGTATATTAQTTQTPAAQNQSSGGFWQKLGNAISGNGWKTNDQVTADQRQWLSDNGTQRRDANGTTSVDWSKASSKDVTAAYNYIHQVMSAANTDHLLSMVGIPSAVTFGHGARHLAGSGLNQADVESAIHQDVEAGVKNATQSTGNFWGRVNVGGQTVEYRAFTLPNGTINVGTYYIP